MVGVRTTTRTTVRRGSLPALIDVPTLAQRLGVRDKFVRRLVDERRVPFVKVGRLVRFDPAQVDAWLATHSVEPVRSVTVPHRRRAS